MWRWRPPKKGVLQDSPASRELPTSQETASTLYALCEFQFRASGTHAEQRTLPYPRQSHCQTLPTLSSLKPALPTCPTPCPETDVPQAHSNKAAGTCSRPSVRPYHDIVELAEIMSVQLKQIRQDRCLLRCGGDDLNMSKWLLCLFCHC